MATKQEIKDEIRKLKAELERIENEEKFLSNIEMLCDFTDEEKCAAFDLLYAHARGGLMHIIEHRYERKDDEYYTYELAVNLTIGKAAFDIINSIL